MRLQASEFLHDGEITEMGILNCLSRVKSQYQGTYRAQTWISRSHNRLHFCSQQWCWGGGWFWGRLVRLGLGQQLVGHLMRNSSMYPIGEDTWLQAEQISQAPVKATKLDSERVTIIDRQLQPLVADHTSRIQYVAEGVLVSGSLGP